MLKRDSSGGFTIDTFCRNVVFFYHRLKSTPFNRNGKALQEVKQR